MTGVAGEVDLLLSQLSAGDIQAAEQLKGKPQRACDLSCVRLALASSSRSALSRRWKIVPTLAKNTRRIVRGRRRTPSRCSSWLTCIVTA